MKTLQHKFVQTMPDEIEEGILYVSIDYATAIHKCVCGCGNEVVTPITPTDWQLTFDGESVSLNPSIGNWNFPCQSHYWIEHDKIRHSRRWSNEEIEYGRENDREKKAAYFRESNENEKDRQLPNDEDMQINKSNAIEKTKNFWSFIFGEKNSPLK